MNRPKTIAASVASLSSVLGLLLAAPLATAHNPMPDALQRCASIDEPSARLACFDRYMQQNSPPEPEARASAPPPEEVSSETQPRDPEPVEAERPAAVGPESPGIVARVTDFQRLRRLRKVRITLDNGQIWQEIDGESFRGSIAEGTEVTIVERRFSGHKMILPDRSETIDVRRLR